MKVPYKQEKNDPLQECVDDIADVKMDSVKLQIVSDLHLEHRSLKFEDVLVAPHNGANVLALLGDIGSPLSNSDVLERFLRECSERYLVVLYVAGNHEYYNQNGIDIASVNACVESLCSRFGNVHFLNNRVITIHDVCFIGTTLWSHVPLQHKQEVENYLNDYRLIFKSNQQRITVEDTNAEFEKNKNFIENAVLNALNSGLKPVVLTHHTPSFFKTSAARFEGKPTTHAFSTQLSCPAGAIRLWCCGHTHFNFHHSVEGYELISNQYGYGNHPATGYRKDLVMCL